MITINLEKKLLKQNKKLVTPKELLLINEYEKMGDLTESDILSRVGLNSNLREGKLIKETIDEKLKQTKKFNKERVFHISQIESICKKYHLRFLQAGYFKGSIDKELPYKLTNFEITYHLKCDSLNTYIVAPKLSFKLQQVPKDPLMFYEINDEYFYLIHKWGNDLNIFRRLLRPLSNGWLTFFTDITIIPLPLLLYFDTDGYFAGMFAVAVLYVVGCVIKDDAIRFAKKNEWDSKFE